MQQVTSDTFCIDRLSTSELALILRFLVVKLSIASLPQNARQLQTWHLLSLRCFDARSIISPPHHHAEEFEIWMHKPAPLGPMPARARTMLQAPPFLIPPDGITLSVVEIFGRYCEISQSVVEFLRAGGPTIAGSNCSNMFVASNASHHILVCRTPHRGPSVHVCGRRRLTPPLTCDLYVTKCFTNSHMLHAGKPPSLNCHLCAVFTLDNPIRLP